MSKHLLRTVARLAFMLAASSCTTRYWVPPEPLGGERPPTAAKAEGSVIFRDGRMVDAGLVHRDQSEVTLNLGEGRVTAAPIASIAVVMGETCTGNPPWKNIERARRCAGFLWAAPDLAAGLSYQTDPVDVALARAIGDAAKGGIATLRLFDGSVVTGTVTVAPGIPYLRVQTEQPTDMLLDPQWIDEMEVYGWSRGGTAAVVLSLVAVALIVGASREALGWDWD